MKIQINLNTEDKNDIVILGNIHKALTENRSGKVLDQRIRKIANEIIKSK